MNGFEYLYGRDDYEGNYSEGPFERNPTPLHTYLGYRSPQEMRDAQRRYAIRKSGDPMDDFEVIE